MTLGASKNAHRVYLGYLELAKILENELRMSKDKDYKKLVRVIIKWQLIMQNLQKL